eukprot:CAMPEP_0172840716 /NCGR_PEP_ID=MMETSP1075-20121228/29519_1 /TAXON_ID=2916 /ORGANISM="Ceratium fusus, Strain PA161109" /LENGTH=290 /DNA_ID=CAMNT_0013684599 /DNA_START=51 /DNA_END=923 /DNA_ORIENTATION=-
MGARRPRLLCIIAAFFTSQLLFAAPRLSALKGSAMRGSRDQSAALVSLQANSRFEKAIAYEAMETPPDDMEGLDALRELVASHKDDPKWARVDDDRVKRHFLASKMDVETAYGKLKKLVEWQSVMFPIDPELIKPEVETGKLILQGHDKDGHPVLYTICRRHNRFERDVNGCISNVVSVVDKAIGSMPPGIGKILLVFDARGLGWKQIDLKMIREAINLLQDRYPVRAYRLYAVGLPSLFGYLWSFAKNFLDPLSASKVVFLKDMQELTEFVEEAEMPAEVLAKIDAVPA